MNNTDWKCRTELLLGKEKMSVLNNAHVFVAGLGGVGAYAAEQLCRAGIGKLTLVDNDIIQPSNRNRQILALQSVQGKLKTDIIASRLKDINPDIVLEKLPVFLDETTIPELMSGQYSYVIDAIDTLTPKVLLLKAAIDSGQKIVSSMGSAGKTDPSLVKVDDIRNSHHCKFAYKVRKYLHRHGISEGITVVYSPEPVKKEAVMETTGAGNKQSVVGSISYMPAIFGCFCAAEVLLGIISSKT